MVDAKAGSRSNTRDENPCDSPGVPLVGGEQLVKRVKVSIGLRLHEAAHQGLISSTDTLLSSRHVFVASSELMVPSP
jgi:hypothetical protein